MTDFPTDSDVELAPVTELQKPQRRVLGVLLEKAFTTPEYYPLTLKSATAACNQKSNRSPVTNYEEDFVAEVMDELRRIGLVGIVYTESARSERYRHYMRKRFDFTEPQLAILTELLLRGRQTLGELRARASRMVPIENLDRLRQELSRLVESNHVQASGPLQRRGVEVDHNFYHQSEGRAIQPDSESTGPAAGSRTIAGSTVAGSTASHSKDAAVADSGRPPAPSRRDAEPPRPSQDVDHKAVAQLSEQAETLARTVEQLRLENKQLRDDLESLREELRQQAEQLEDLRRDLGG